MIIDMHNLSLDETIAVITSPASEMTFPYERHIRVHQFETWIMAPQRPDLVTMAGLHVAARGLKELEGTCEDATSLADLSARIKYVQLYDAVILKYGGLRKLLAILPPDDHDAQVFGHENALEVICNMINYRFRYLDHKTGDPKNADIGHSHYFCWNKPIDGRLSYKTIKSYWKYYKRSAVFLYVSKLLEYYFYPCYVCEPDLLNTLSKRSEASDELKRVLGQCAYVAETLGDNSLIGNANITKEIKRVRPKTKPLRPELMARMQDYDERKLDMQNDTRDEI